MDNNKNLPEENATPEGQTEGQELNVMDVLSLAIDSGEIPDEKDISEQQQEQWKQFVKKVKASDLLDNLLREILRDFKKQHNTLFPNENIEFKLHLRKNNKTGVVWSVNLILEMKRFGLWTVITQSTIDFKHIREIREEATWKYRLYQSVISRLLSIGITYIIATRDYQEHFGKQKPNNDATN